MMLCIAFIGSKMTFAFKRSLSFYNVWRWTMLSVFFGTGRVIGSMLMGGDWILSPFTLSPFFSLHVGVLWGGTVVGQMVGVGCFEWVCGVLKKFIWKEESIRNMAEFQSQERVKKKEYDETLCEWELRVIYLDPASCLY